MLKKELVYLKLLKEKETTQKQISEELDISLSTVNYAIKPLRQMGSVKVTRRKLTVLDEQKLLLYWATCRKLDRDILYSTHAEKGALEIEKGMPAGTLYTAYSGYRLKYDDAPADYSEVYVYANENAMDYLKKAFPKNERRPNLFVLNTERVLEEESEKGIVPVEVLYVDLWNLKEWYAREFLKALEEKLYEEDR